MSRFVASTLAVVVLLAANAAAARAPNIVFILADDLGWADLGCYGSTFHETPELDRLARLGMRFTQAYAAAPLCSPTRASFLTGRHPARLHLTTYLPGRPDSPLQKLLQPTINQQLSLRETTLAEALKPLGYVSAHIGKWHLGGKGFGPEDQGFALNLAGTDGGSPPGPGGYFRFQTPTLKADDDAEYLTDRLTTEAERFIENNRDKPFFLYLCHFAVHIPLQAKPDLIAKYQAKRKAPWQDDPKKAPAQDNPVYAAVLESLDQGVGRVMRKLDELGLADDTLLVFMSDNGGLAVREGPDTPATSNAPLRGAKGQLYEGGIRVPLIVRWPGRIKAGAVCDVPVSSADWFPTLLRVAGSKPEPGIPLDGIDILPVLQGTAVRNRDTLFWHLPHYSNQGGRPSGAIRRGNLKLIEHYEDGRLELFDLAKDVSEKNDLSAAMPEQARELRRLLAEWRRSVDAQMPTPNPDYDPNWTPPAKKPAATK
jgi:arylsulfatase A-like enzyme